MRAQAHLWGSELMRVGKWFWEPPQIRRVEWQDWYECTGKSTNPRATEHPKTSRQAYILHAPSHHNIHNLFLGCTIPWSYQDKQVHGCHHPNESPAETHQKSANQTTVSSISSVSIIKTSIWNAEMSNSKPLCLISFALRTSYGHSMILG